MSDSDELDIDGDESPDLGSKQKKKGGLGSLLPTILKFAAIGIGAIIFIVTVCVITYNFMRGDGVGSSPIHDPQSPYIGRLPVFSYYTEIPTITTSTRDSTPRYTVSVVIHIGYDQNDTAVSSELNFRRSQLQEFFRRYFAGKMAHELAPENEVALKREIIEQLNTRFLDPAKIRDIAFVKLDIMEVF